MTQGHDLATPDWIENENYRQSTRRLYWDASHEISKALRKLKTTSPSFRLYEKQGEEVYMKALMDHARRIHKLECVDRELTLLAEYIEPLDYYSNGKRMQDAGATP